jgi:hypothetical protein
MTVVEFKALVDAQLPDNNEGLITPQLVRVVLKALADVIEAGGFE